MTTRLESTLELPAEVPGTVPVSAVTSAAYSSLGTMSAPLRSAADTLTGRIR